MIWFAKLDNWKFQVNKFQLGPACQCSISFLLLRHFYRARKLTGEECSEVNRPAKQGTNYASLANSTTRDEVKKAVQCNAN